jgi:hypothetical protein
MKRTEEPTQTRNTRATITRFKVLVSFIGIIDEEERMYYFSLRFANVSSFRGVTKPE